MRVSPRGKGGSGDTLSRQMKSYSKVKSPECLLKTTRKGNILKHMTSTTNKRSSPKTNTYQDSFLDTTKVISISHEDISGIVPFNETRSSLLDLTPKITISNCSNEITNQLAPHWCHTHDCECWAYYYC